MPLLHTHAFVVPADADSQWPAQVHGLEYLVGLSAKANRDGYDLEMPEVSAAATRSTSKDETAANEVVETGSPCSFRE